MKAEEAKVEETKVEEVEKKQSWGEFSKFIMVFSQEGKLIALSPSNRAIAKITSASSQSISYACNGKTDTAGGLYFRYLDSSIEIEISDLGNLKLADYDKMCGVERGYKKKKTRTKASVKKSKASKDGEVATTKRKPKTKSKAKKRSKKTYSKCLLKNNLKKLEKENEVKTAEE